VPVHRAALNGGSGFDAAGGRPQVELTRSRCRTYSTRGNQGAPYLNLKFLYGSNAACWLRLLRHFVFTEQGAACRGLLRLRHSCVYAQRLDPRSELQWSHVERSAPVNYC
jgi:hypothetical protein